MSSFTWLKYHYWTVPKDSVQCSDMHNKFSNFTWIFYENWYVYCYIHINMGLRKLTIGNNWKETKLSHDRQCDDYFHSKLIFYAIWVCSEWGNLINPIIVTGLPDSKVIWNISYDTYWEETIINACNVVKFIEFI